MACDIQTLFDEAGCLPCLTPFQLGVIQSQLLCTISENGGGGGSSLQQVYIGVWADPNGNVTPITPSKAARYSQYASSGGTGVEWHWQTDTLNWI